MNARMREFWVLFVYNSDIVIYTLCVDAHEYPSRTERLKVGNCKLLRFS
jgi:hypothetical protein